MNTPTMHRPDRHPLRCSSLPILAVLMLVPLSAIADTPGPTAPPATAAPPPSPKAVALAFTAALEKGDTPTAKALLPPDDVGRAKWVDATVALTTGLKKL